jgi:hypothetical protein
LAALIKELLLDLANNAIVQHKNSDIMLSKGMGISWEYLSGWEEHCEFRCDVVNSMQSLIDTQQVDKRDILILSKFMSGLSTTELSIDYPDAYERLVRTLALLEYASGYTDSAYLQRVVSRYPKYAQTLSAFREKMHLYGREFNGS